MPGEEPLRLAVASILSPEESYGAYKRFSDYLASKLGRPVELVQRFGYRRINDLIEEGAADLAVLCTGGYCDVVNRGGGEALLVPVVAGATTYRSLLVTRRDSGVSAFAALRGRTFVFTEPLSLTGFIYPWVRLEELGGARSVLGSYFFSRSHDRSLRSVRFGLADAASVDERVWRYFQEVHPEVVRDLAVVESSPAYPMAPLVVPTGMDPQLKARLKRVLLEMHDAPSGALVLADLGIERFSEPDQKGYEGVRELFLRVEGRVDVEP